MAVKFGLHPTMVRLQLYPAVQYARTSMPVSIPLWFDCNPSERRRDPSIRESLHPTMVRLQPFRCSGGRYRLVSLHPTMVRLQLSGRKSSRTRVSSVSIPLWFDCNPTPQSTNRKPSCCWSPSHYGSTATYIGLLLEPSRLPSPSHYGSTATNHGVEIPIVKKVLVSIPLWFDCNIPPIIAWRE